jgi:DNA-binding CsgD family transcriptional regulator
MFQVLSDLEAAAIPPAVRSQAAVERSHEWMLRRLIDQLDDGIAVCDVEGALLLANQAAWQELDDGELICCRDGLLVTTAGTGGRCIEAAVRAAGQRGRRQLVPLHCGTTRLLVSVVPMPDGGTDPGGPGQLVMVLMGRRQPCSDLGLQLFATAHGLTAAEQRVLGALLAEATPREVAQRFGVALSTVRTQIASLRAKLDAHSLEVMLLRAARTPPVGAALRRMVA